MLVNAEAMGWMGIEALCRRPRTTKSEPGHKIYPYLLRNMGTDLNRVFPDCNVCTNTSTML